MRFINTLYRWAYERPCRAYARWVVKDSPADIIYSYLSAVHFWKFNRYWPQLRKPRTFSEKIWHRQLYDRDPRWTLLSDKLRARDYIAEKIGKDNLIPLLWHGDDPDKIPFDQLPFKFVIKANHGCGYNIIVQDKTQLDQSKVRLQLKTWLGENYCLDTWIGIQWGYKNIKPCIIVESFLESNEGIPADYKFECFSGRAEFVQIDHGRFTNDHHRTFVDRDFNRFELEYDHPPHRGEIVRPANFEEMLHLAESLAAAFDFIRVDLYSLNGRVYVGELTPYPGGGCIRFVPRKYDFLFGEKWKLKR